MGTYEVRSGIVRSPVEYFRVLDPDRAPKVRKLLCRYYNACLRHAEDQGWGGFACTSCTVEESISREDQRADLESMAKMFGFRDREVRVVAEEFDGL